MIELPVGESSTIELKESLSDLSAIIETTVAFSNSKGGKIFIGISDNGKIKGISIGKKTLEQIANAIAQETKPKIYPEIEEIRVNEKSIIVISVNEGVTKPYLFKGTGYKRVGKANIKLDLEELENLILKKHMHTIFFDNSPSDASFDDVDESEVLKFLNEAKIRRNQIFTSNDVHAVLKNLDLLKQGKILNGGIICFGKDPQRLFPQFCFRCAVFRNGLIINHQLMEGSLFRIIEDVQKFTMLNIQRSYIIKGAKREDIFEYPIEAIREAIINAIVHRDYFSNASNYLLIDENHIEIKNPGLLPKELKISDLKELNHSSIPRNKFIARVAYLSGYIEQWGTGTTKIIDSCRAAGLIDPVFEEKQGFFIVSIYKKKFQLSERQAEALRKFADKEFTSNQYAKNSGLSRRAAILDINKLLKAGFLIKENKGKNTFYIHSLA